MYIPIAVAPDGGRVAHPHHGEQASFKYKRTLWLGPTDGSLIWQGDLCPLKGSIKSLEQWRAPRCSTTVRERWISEAGAELELWPRPRRFAGNLTGRMEGRPADIT